MLIIPWAFLNKGQGYLPSVTFIWTVPHCSGVGEWKGSFPLNPLGWNLIIQLQSDSSPYCKRVGQTLSETCKVSSNASQPGIRMDQLAKDHCSRSGKVQLEMTRAMQRDCIICTARETMANGCFFGHPFITVWGTQVWALELTGPDKSLLWFCLGFSFCTLTATVLHFIPGLTETAKILKFDRTQTISTLFFTLHHQPCKYESQLDSQHRTVLF